MSQANETRWERLGAASGLVSFALGAVGGALERGWPDANDSVAVAAFIADERAAILGQSMAFVLSAVVFVWFAGALRSFLARAEGGTGRLSAVVFGTACTWASLQLVAQAFQVGQAMAPDGGRQPALLWTMAAMFSTSNLPLGAMLLAVAVVALRHGALPAWLGAISLVAAAAQTLLWLGTVVRSGPLAPNGWLTYVLYPLFAVWIVPTVVVMVRRTGAAHDAAREAPRTGARPLGPREPLPQG